MKTPIFRFLIVCIAFILILFNACDDTQVQKMEVTATAYNSLKGQTQGHPAVTAWGDTLEPGMKAIAVSRDLIDSGLTHGTKVKIEGLSGYYVVRDKMNKRWTKKIDIYLGASEEKAKEWGKQHVGISWKLKNDAASN
jgi:3D (Asp-Asp-Asp) domain-containing protein